MKGRDEPWAHAYTDTVPQKLAKVTGWMLGWLSFCLAKLGSTERAESLADDAIALKRANSGAIRTIGHLNGLRGLPAIRRGKLIIHGRMGNSGQFANLGFFATYHVAAPNKMRALALIKRFERDAIPESLEVEDGELDQADEGAEGVLWIAGGRTYYLEDAPP